MTIHQPALTTELSSLARLIADYSVQVLSERRQGKVQLNSNVKMLRAGLNGGAMSYLTMACSSNPDLNRLNAERSKPPSAINDNAMYRLILMSEGKKDYCLVPNIEEFAETVPFPFLHPDNDDMKYYKSCLVVAIHGPKSQILDRGSPEARVTASFGENASLSGFICVDSKEYGAFNDGWDLMVMREMATKAFNAFRLYTGACYALRLQNPDVR